MNNTKQLTVRYHEQPVGTLALLDQHLVTFQYDRDWLTHGFALNPFSLPLESRVFIPNLDPFDGVFGIFADSLPDGWGRLLLDCRLKEQGIAPSTVDELTRLAIVGDRGLGALTYEPSLQQDVEVAPFSLDELAQDALGILTWDAVENLDTLFELGGSSGGARPKIMTEIDGQDWIIKFFSHQDAPDIGVQEYQYAQCARICGIEMSETRLFDSQRTSGYFGTKRFDRLPHEDGTAERIHTASVSALLETTHRYPLLDYVALLQLTLELTRDFEQVEQQFRRMCFNVFAENRDDHAKNFAFQHRDGEWRLSPAYDLTHSSSVGGEHATSVAGNGKAPSMHDLLEVARSIGLKQKRARAIATEVEAIVNEMLASWIG